MPLDPAVATVLGQFPPFDPNLSPAELRAAGRDRRPPRSGDPSVGVADLTVPGLAGPIPARHYVPAEGNSGRGLLVYYHGGGFVLGDLESHDGICRDLASGSGVAVLSVDYRLAPEHPFPAGVEDAWAALGWVHAHAGALGADPGNLAVGGDSAGGNLAAVVALMARDEGIGLRLQLLVYPVTDETEERRAARARDDAGIFLTTVALDWFDSHYRPDRDDWRASPLVADDLTGTAPALVITCEYDPLRSEGDEYAHRLEAAGVTVTHRSYPGLIHGVFGMGAAVPASQALMDESCAALRAALASGCNAR
ncbi:MAG: alpha/beta hydrolase [Acidimicrobiales bacterium]